MAARILVSNQVILASIWYIASGADLAKTVLHKARAMVRNFIWGGDASKNSRARVRWDSAILPIAHGGIKIFDPYAQASALLAKLISRGLEPGPEPWKVLLRHKVGQIRRMHKGPWGPDAEWLLTARRIKDQGSPLWRGVWSSWLEVRPGINRTPPTNQEEAQRHSIFLNPFLSSTDIIQWGDDEDPRAGVFCNWSIKNITKLKHLRTEDQSRWLDMAEIRNRTRSFNIPEIRRELIDSVPWSMDQIHPYV